MRTFMAIGPMNNTDHPVYPRAGDKLHDSANNINQSNELMAGFDNLKVLLIERDIKVDQIDQEQPVINEQKVIQETNLNWLSVGEEYLDTTVVPDDYDSPATNMDLISYASCEASQTAPEIMNSLKEDGYDVPELKNLLNADATMIWDCLGTEAALLKNNSAEQFDDIPMSVGNESSVVDIADVETELLLHPVEELSKVQIFQKNEDIHWYCHSELGGTFDFKCGSSPEVSKIKEEASEKPGISGISIFKGNIAAPGIRYESSSQRVQQIKRRPSKYTAASNEGSQTSPVKRKPSRPRKVSCADSMKSLGCNLKPVHEKKALYKYLIRMLDEYAGIENKECVVSWRDRSSGLFHVNHTDNFAEALAVIRGRKKVSYTNIARSFRYYKKVGIFTGHDSLTKNGKKGFCVFKFNMKNKDVKNYMEGHGMENIMRNSPRK